MDVGYLGPKNSFTFQAASTLTEQSSLIAYSTIPFCIQALVSNEIKYAVIPIENSLEGSVHVSMDQLFKNETLEVIREIVLPIRQQLLVAPGTTQPKKIMSHPQALAQSQQFLETHYPDVLLEAVSSTTYAADFVAKHPELPLGAIASVEAANEYQLKRLAKDIQDNADNQTRFWVLQNKKNVQKQRNKMISIQKTTLFVTLPANLPGALHKVLSALAWRNIDLSKIESRPLKTSLGEYFFIIDLVFEENEQLIDYAIEEMEQLQISVRKLGSYPITNEQIEVL